MIDKLGQLNVHLFAQILSIRLNWFFVERDVEGYSLKLNHLYIKIKFKLVRKQRDNFVFE